MTRTVDYATALQRTYLRLSDLSPVAFMVIMMPEKAKGGNQVTLLWSGRREVDGWGNQTLMKHLGTER